jgi:hypothetical protein
VKSTLRTSLVLGALALAACEPASDEILVARAADRSLSVDAVVQLLGPRADLPNEVEVVRAVADLWIDYTLFAKALADDPSLSQLDFEPLVGPELEQQAILQLRDAAVEADTAITEAELRDLFAREAPGVTARASHILLTVPERATAEQRDSVRAQAERLRERVLDGEDLGALARNFSQDRGSARNGGSLGSFGRGQLVRPLDEAIFALDTGEVGPVVESPYGYHVVRLDELSAPAFDSIAADFRLAIQGRRFQVAESIFITELQDAAEPVVEETAAELVREVAADPLVGLAGRTASRVVARYRGGNITLEEVRDFMQTRAPEYLAQVQQAPDEVLEEQVVLSMIQRELLVEEAYERGFEPTAAARDSLTDIARGNFVETGRQLGLAGLTVGDPPDGISRAVTALLGGIVSGAREVVPLGAISVIVRDEYRHGIEPVGVDATVARIGEIRGPGAPATPPSPPAMGDTAAAGDTAGTPPPAGGGEEPQ